MKRIHFITGIIISLFVGLHLFNHLLSLFGEQRHIEIMKMLRNLYRNIFIETILLFSILAQIYTGINQFRLKKLMVKSFFEKLQIWSGLYLAIFFVIHLSAIFAGRFMLKVDTNFYFGAAGLNLFPFNLFFIPYYGIAILSFFGHLASIHSKKMKMNILALSPTAQAKVILLLGICIMLLIFYGFTNGFKGIIIPKEYSLLIEE